ncbi:MAG: hypothetical protein IT337_06140 [Thermomicrobiales bacterium]|nr:hypothetical protein [Thermomicrobiales bacterium]
MPQRDSEPEQLRAPDAAEQARLPFPRFALFRRLYRWLNLTLIHQGLWPLLIVVVGAPTGRPTTLPIEWWLARLAGPALAALLAGVYLAQRPAGLAPELRSVSPLVESRGQQLRQQAALLLPGLAVMLALARLVVGPAEPVAKVMLFGIADVAAFQLIHFGVVARSWPDPDEGAAAAVGLFGVSWGLRELFLRVADPAGGSGALAFFGGLAVGLAFGALSWVLRRWPGGFWPAAAAQVILVYLIAGFV